MSDTASIELDSNTWLELWREARTAAGVELLPRALRLADYELGTTSDDEEDPALLIDAEIIAIYW